MLILISSKLNIWKLSNGKIIHDIKVPNINEVIEDCLFVQDNLIVISNQKVNNISSQFSLIKIYQLDLENKSDKSSTLKSKYKIDRGKKLLYFPSTKRNELAILKEELNKPSIQIFKINLNYIQNSELLLESNGQVDLSSITTSSTDLFTENSNVCVTNKNNIFVIFLNTELIFIDLNSKNILLRQNIDNLDESSLKYFLSPTNIALNKLKNLQNVSTNSDDLVALGNLDNLVYINYDFTKNKVKIFESNETAKNRAFVSFVIRDKIIIGHDKLNNKLIGFDLNEMNYNPFNKSNFEISLQDSTLETYGLSNDNKYVYLIENRTTLKFYRWNNNKKIAETQLYSKVINVLCTNEYICMAMEDRRIISLLIVDPLVPNSNDKIKQLESRSKILDKKRKKMVKKLVEKSSLIDDSSSESDCNLDIFNEKDSEKEKDLEEVDRPRMPVTNVTVEEGSSSDEEEKNGEKKPKEKFAHIKKSTNFLKFS